MALEKAPHWTELYYAIIEHYFWSPQYIGRKSDPATRHPWDYWKERLERLETPLNHMLDLLFHIAPHEITDSGVNPHVLMAPEFPTVLRGKPRIHEFPFPGEGGLSPKRTLQLIRPQYWSGASELLWDGSDPDYYDLTPSSEPRTSEWSTGDTSFIELKKISAAGPVMTVDVRLPGLFADLNHTGPETGAQATPFNTIGEAVDGLRTAGKDLTIRAKPGTYSENGLLIDTPCSVMPWEDGTVYIGQ